MPGAKENAVSLVAEKGFEPHANAGDGYGRIEQLSPVFLQKGGQGHYFLHDCDWVKKGGKGEQEFRLMAETGKRLRYDSLTGDGQSAVSLVCKAGSKTETYTGKYKPAEWMVEVAGKERVACSELFHAATATGVYKFVSRSLDEYDQDSAYFKNVSQILGKLEAIGADGSENSGFHLRPTDRGLELVPKWTFAFYVKMKDTTTLAASGSRVVMMGKERSAFLTDVTAVADKEELSWMQVEAGTGLQRVVLLSDAYVDETSLLKHSLLVHGSTVRFRSMARNYETHRFEYANLPKKSDCHHLLKRGSVIYTEDAAAVAALLAGEGLWRGIGNNYFTIRPTEKNQE